MKFIVNLHVEKHLQLEVEAKTKEEAIEKATEIYQEQDEAPFSWKNENTNFEAEKI